MNYQVRFVTANGHQIGFTHSGELSEFTDSVKAVMAHGGYLESKVGGDHGFWIIPANFLRSVIIQIEQKKETDEPS